MTNHNQETTENIQLLTYTEALASMRNEVDRVLSTSPSLIRGYTEHLKASRGKFIRAMSLLACALNDDNLIHPDAVKFAAAIEILHLATLVHDDVIDNAKLRRGVITLQKKYGRKTAVICGDYLFSVALRMASSVHDREKYNKLELPDYIGRVCLGELNQHLHNGNLDITVTQYLRIISGKTAALFEAAFLAGIVVVEDDVTVHHDYMRLGHYIGMIFQLTDDCIDYEETEKIAKKPVQSDFEQGVITLPLIYTFGKVNDFKQKAKDNQVSRSELINTVLRADGLSYTRIVAQKYYNKAVRIMDRISLSEEKRAVLMEILDKAFYGSKKK